MKDFVLWIQNKLVSMLNSILARLWIFCQILFTFVLVLDASPYGGLKYRPDRILVLPKPGVNLDSLHAAYQGKIKSRFSFFNDLQIVEVPPGRDIKALVKEYLRSGLVQFAEPDFIVHASVIPNDTYFYRQWALNNTGQFDSTNRQAQIHATAAWDVFSNASNIIVAILDTGIRQTHEDLVDNLWVNVKEVPGNNKDDDRNGFIDDVHGINAITLTGNPEDDNGHGTHVAGIIGAVANNSKGISGVAWRVQIMACKFLDSDGKGALSDAIVCLDYARQNGAKVINASWDSDEYSSSLRLAIQKLQAAGIIFVTAAGNESSNNDLVPVYPANYDLDNIISVAATDCNDELASFSNYGANTVDIAAPGSNIYSTWNSGDSDYTISSGTSMAAPFVSGAIALLRARFPYDTYKDCIQRLLNNVDVLDSLQNKCVSGGRLNLYKAIGPALVADFKSSSLQGALPLTVYLTNTSVSVGNLVSCRWDFSDGSSPATNANPVVTFLKEGNYTISLSVTDDLGNTSSLSKPVNIVANYTISSTNYAWIDPTNKVYLQFSKPTTDLAEIKLDGCFNFYAQVYDTIYISKYGFISFNNKGLSIYSNTDIPLGSDPNTAIYPWWDYLDPSLGGSVWYSSTTVNSNRLFVVTWEKVPHHDSTNTIVTFQVILFLDNGNIQFQYKDVAAQKTRGAGKSATVGIENETGTVAVKYTYNGYPNILTNGQSLIFKPTSEGGLVVTPCSDITIPGSIGGPFETNVITWAISNSSVRDINVSLNCAAEWLSFEDTNIVLRPNENLGLRAFLNNNSMSLTSGVYKARVSFFNNTTGIGNTVRFASLVITQETGLLNIVCPSELVSKGPFGGPFEPGQFSIILTNSGDLDVNWTATKGQIWLDLSSNNGVISPSDSYNLVLSFNENASNLIAGVYSDKVIISSENTGQTPFAISVYLTVVEIPRLELSLERNTLKIKSTGMPGFFIGIDATTDFQYWVNVFSNKIDENGIIEFYDTNFLNFRNRYYRAVQYEN